LLRVVRRTEKHWESFAAVYAETAEPIEMPYLTRVGPKKHILAGWIKSDEFIHRREG